MYDWYRNEDRNLQKIQQYQKLPDHSNGKYFLMKHFILNGVHVLSHSAIIFENLKLRNTF